VATSITSKPRFWSVSNSGVVAAREIAASGQSIQIQIRTKVYSGVARIMVPGVHNYVKII